MNDEGLSAVAPESPSPTPPAKLVLPTLRELAKQDAELRAMIDTSVFDGTETEETRAIRETIDALPIEVKAARVIHVIQEFEDDADILASAAAVFQKRADDAAKAAKAHANKADWLRRYLKENLALANRFDEKRQCRIEVRDESGVVKELFKLTISPGRARVHVADDFRIGNVPRQFLRVPEPDLDKKAVLKAHENGEALPPGVTVERGPETLKIT